MDEPNRGDAAHRLARRRADDLPPPWWVPFADSGLVLQDESYLRWRLRPAHEAIWNGKTVKTNSLGYRSPEIAEKKPEGTYRVIVLGSSNTFGHGVEDEEMYVRHLERWLDHEAGPDIRVEVVNLAVSGDSPSQRLMRLKADAVTLSPDWILCDVTALDFSLEEDHLEWVVSERKPIPFSHIDKALTEAEVSADEPPQVRGQKLRAVYEALLSGTFAGWAAESSRLGVPLTILVLPRADKKSTSPALFDLIRRVASTHRLDTIDLSGSFASLTTEQFQVAPWDKHPSPLGHEAIFESLRVTLSQRGGPPGLTGSFESTLLSAE